MGDIGGSRRTTDRHCRGAWGIYAAGVSEPAARQLGTATWMSSGVQATR
jgi:hypothetical protein